MKAALDSSPFFLPSKAKSLLISLRELLYLLLEKEIFDSHFHCILGAIKVMKPGLPLTSLPWDFSKLRKFKNCPRRHYPLALMILWADSSETPYARDGSTFLVQVFF